MITKRRLGAALLLTAVLAGRPARAQDSATQHAPEPGPTPPRTPARQPAPKAKARQPIRVSIDDAVAEVLRAHEQPCDRAEREGVPCFPLTVETEGPRFSVAEALRRYSATSGRPAPGGPPRTAELQKQFSGTPATPLGGYSFDPGCALKSLRRMVSGRGNTFYLYRIQDRLGTEPLLTDHRLSREALEAHPEIRELMGEYFGECDAINAWRKALREQRAAEQAADDPPRESAPKDAAP